MALFRDDNDKQYEVLLAEHRLVSDIQLAIENGMKQKGFSQADLARGLGVSDARVSQLLSDSGKNLQARTIARIAHVLGLRVIINFNSEVDDQMESRPRATGDFADWVKLIQEKKRPAWENASNDDCYFESMDRQVA